MDIFFIAMDYIIRLATVFLEDVAKWLGFDLSTSEEAAGK